jgi:hypothetical protein
MQPGSIRTYAYIPLILLQVDCTCTNTSYIGNDYYICINLLTSAFLRFSKALGIGSWMGRPSFTSLLTVNGIDGTASGFNRAWNLPWTPRALPSSKGLAQNNAQNTTCDWDGERSSIFCSNVSTLFRDYCLSGMKKKLIPFPFFARLLQPNAAQ